MASWGVLLPTFDALRTGRPPQITAAARLAEDAGLDGVWAGDHLWCPAPILDAPSALAAAAAVTNKISIGTSVLLLGMRPLAWTAKQIATLQALSANRLKLGVGIGGEFPVEYAAAEVPIKERGERLDRAIDLLPRLLGGEPFPDDWPVTTEEHPLPPLEPTALVPPLIVGGRSDIAQQRAIRAQAGWMPMWLSAETLKQRIEFLKQLAVDANQPTPKVTLLVLAHVDDDQSRAREAADQHLKGQYRMGIEQVERWTALGSVSAVAEFLSSYEGVDEFVLMPLADRNLEQFERLAEVVRLTRS
jgi:alkanesulfonate monooxygenase SsuD/methylene tetrahydromethanopterin reductase-like flavin-dependent oxidoreductase (luciferase family)